VLRVNGVVNIRQYGATSSTDALDSIQYALNSGAKVVTGDSIGVFTISAPLSIPSGVTFDLKGTIKAGDIKTGELSTRGALVTMYGVSQAKLLNATLLPSDTAYALGASFSGVVIIDGASTECQVLGCDIDATGINTTNPAFTEGVTCLGSFCLVDNNKITAGGVRYATATSSSNKVSNNKIYGGQISGNVNTSTDVSYGHIIDNNTLIFPTRMGIEDQGQPQNNQFLSGTRITNNTIVGGNTPEFFAISAVSTNTIITGNSIVNWGNEYAIEIFSDYSVTISNNSIVWTDGNPNDAIGIQSQISPYEGGANLISNNVITGAKRNVNTACINIRGESRTVVTGNSFYGCSNILLCSTNIVECTFTDNAVLMSTLATENRTLITGGDNFIAKGNRVKYDSTVTGTAYNERVFQAGWDGTIIDGNFIDGGNVVNNGAVLGFLSNGVTGTNVKIINNNFKSGTRIDYSHLIDPVVDNNEIDGAKTQHSRVAKGFYDATPIVKQSVTGSKGSNVALTDLIAKLVLLGLINDSTT
tara:strand:+ start:37 stop:1626 length:1590 start_codon:yes stop_codon:yes gene_type:complete